MPDTVVVVDDSTPAEPVQEPATETVVVEVSEDHDVDFAERITRLETESVNWVRRDELTYLHERLSAVEGVAVTAAVTAEAAAEVAVEAATEPEPEPEPKPEPPKDEAPQSKKSRWWGM